MAPGSGVSLYHKTWSCVFQNSVKLVGTIYTLKLTPFEPVFHRGVRQGVSLNMIKSPTKPEVAFYKTM